MFNITIKATLYLTIFLLLNVPIVGGLCHAFVYAPVAYQEHSNWCWAGASKSVLGYYGTTVQQCDIANYAIRNNSCCGNNIFSWNNVCNSGNYLGGHGINSGDVQDILSHWGVGSNYKQSILSLQDCVSEINKGKPFIIQVNYSNNNAHILVVDGYDLNNSGVNYIHYMDPAFGYSVENYLDIVYAPLYGRTWQLTLTTNITSVATLDATSITFSGAVLAGSVNPNGLSTTVTFEYGTTTSYGSAVSADNSPVSGNTNVIVNKVITGLTPGTTYHYRVKQSNSSGFLYGIDKTFTTAKPTLIVDKLGTGTGTISIYSFYVPGGAYELTANPDPDSYFKGWSGDCSGTGDCYIYMMFFTNRNPIVHGTFDLIPSYSLSISKSGAGTGSVTSTSSVSPVINCDSVCSYLLVQNTSVSLNATPKPGNIFTGWSGACTGKGPCSVTMSSPQSVSANFVPEITPILMMLLND
ncbi:MAG: C39 family peptidase [Bacteroidia bacterium]|nr:C39 family peptidase [Bacteroidia bacterium]